MITTLPTCKFALPWLSAIEMTVIADQFGSVRMNSDEFGEFYGPLRVLNCRGRQTIVLALRRLKTTVISLTQHVDPCLLAYRQTRHFGWALTRSCDFCITISTHGSIAALFLSSQPSRSKNFTSMKFRVAGGIIQEQKLVLPNGTSTRRHPRRAL
jgi:hypothetical protein